MHLGLKRKATFIVSKDRTQVPDFLHEGSMTSFFECGSVIYQLLTSGLIVSAPRHERAFGIN